MWADAALSVEWRKVEIGLYGGRESYSMAPYVLRDGGCPDDEQYRGRFHLKFVAVAAEKSS